MLACIFGDCREGQSLAVWLLIFTSVVMLIGKFGKPAFVSLSVMLEIKDE